MSLPARIDLSKNAGEVIGVGSELGNHTGRPLFLDQPFQREIQHFTTELAEAHEHDLGLARRPYQSRVDDAESLRDEGEPGAEIGNWVVGILSSPLVNVGIDGRRTIRSERE